MEVFEAICDEYYTALQLYQELNVLHHQIITLIDNCTINSQIAKLNLPPSLTTELIELYKTIGFSKDAEISVLEYQLLIKVKNRSRSKIHLQGQQSRLEQLELDLQQHIENEHISYTELIKRFMNSHGNVGFLNGLEHYFYLQSRTKDAIVWELQRFHFTETGISNFSTDAVKLLFQLSFTFIPQQDVLEFRSGLDLIECFKIEQFLYLNRKDGVCNGNFRFKKRLFVIENTLWDSITAFRLYCISCINRFFY